METKTYTNKERAELKSLLGRAQCFYVVIPGTDHQIIETTKELMACAVDRTFDGAAAVTVVVQIGEVEVRAGWTNVTIIINEINS